MPQERPLDCIVIGYNDVPFENYERLLHGYGEASEAYRDLQYSFINLHGEKQLYADAMNYAVHLAKGEQNGHKGEQNGHVNQVFGSGEIPNLAAAYLTNFLNKRSFATQYINLYQREKEELAALLEKNPLCVAITTTFYVINYPVNEMVEFIRQHNPEVKIVVGGPLIANHSRNYKGEALEAALRDLGADIYVVEGQGEWTLAQILGALKEDGDLSKVPNLYYIEGESVHKTEVQAEFNSLDENAIDWVSLASGGDLGATLQTRTARSCAFSCAFCNYPTRAGKLVLANLDTLEREFDQMHSLGNVKNVVFIDDTFNVPLPRFKDICRLMIKKKYGWNWFSYFRCSNSDDEAIELMAESGCKGVFLGIESGSPTILENMNKRATVDKYLQGVQKLKANGVITFGSFITGFPGETEETATETIDFINAAGFDFYRSQLWYCEAGTPIFMQRDKYDIEGDGFIWSHATMDSMEAMDWIDQTFLQVKNSTWLPQFSFDFWIIPYVLGKGVREEDFKAFMQKMHQMLALEVAFTTPGEKERMQQDLVGDMVQIAGAWTALP